MDLFPVVQKRSKPLSLLLPQCDACGLYKTCKSPKMPVHGEGRRKILVAGEAPGKTEDDVNRPFVGAAGDVLKKTLRRLGVDLTRDCWITNSLRCRPVNNEITNDKCVEHCRPFMVQAIEELKPEKIILLGGKAVESVLGWTYKSSPGGIYQWAGYQVPDRKLNCWICPTFHPAALLHEKDPRVITLFFDRHLESAFSLEGRPYETPPDASKQLHLEYDPDRASDLIHRLIDSKGPVAFDYETTHATPYSEGSAILCVALSDGARAYATPWSVPVRDALRDFLTSAVPKLAHNFSFEHQWSVEKLGVEPKNWFWDAMTTQHALDNRKGVCGLKFLSYAILGAPVYDEHVEPYCSSATPHGRNRLHELPIKELLGYCATDALYNWEVSKWQCKQAKVRWPG